MTRKKKSAAAAAERTGYAAVVEDETSSEAGPTRAAPPSASNVAPAVAHKNAPVLYDETFRGMHDTGFNIFSIANHAGLIAYLPHHSVETDGSFSVCVAPGEGVFVKEALYNSIPQAYRPPLDVRNAKQIPYELMQDTVFDCVGSTIFPFTFRDDSGKQFTIKLFALVVKNMLHAAFIANGQDWLLGQSTSTGRQLYHLDLNGAKITLPGR